MAQTVYKELNNRLNGAKVELICGHDAEYKTSYYAVETTNGLNELTHSPKYKIMTSQVFGSHQYFEANKQFTKLAKKYL